MPSSNTPKILLSIPLDRCKNFLDTDIYRALKERHPITIFSYLADRDDFQRTYGGPDVHFHKGVEISGRWRWFVYNLTEVLRHFGFLYRWRKSRTALYWHAETKYRWLDPEEFRVKRRVRHLVFVILSFLENRIHLRALLVRYLGWWIFENAQLDEFFLREEPTVYICTAHKTDQEKILSYYARRHKLKSIFVPDSVDNYYMNGSLFHEFDWFCIYGPKMREHARELHGIEEHRLVKLGIPANRLCEKLLRQGGSYKVRERLEIPSHVRIITYLSIWRLGYLDLLPTIDYLLESIESGRIRDAILVLRPSPWEDFTEILARYGNRPSIRLQLVQSNGQFDSGGTDYLFEYVETLRQSSVVVMSATTGALLQTCLLRVPAIANLVELSEYPREGFSPLALEKTDSFDLFKTGLPAAHSLEELVWMINEYLEHREKDRDVWKRILDEWDYQNENYIEDFVGLIEGRVPASANALQKEEEPGRKDLA